MKIDMPQTLPQEAARGLALAFGVVTLGVWGMLGYGWYLGPTHHVHRTAHAPAPAVAAAPVVAQTAATTTVGQPGVTTPAAPRMADPTQRQDEAAPAPEPVSVVPIKRLPQSHSLLVAEAAPVKAAVRAPAVAAPDADGRQVAADAGLEEAGDLPARSAGAVDVRAADRTQPVVANKPGLAGKPAPVAANPAPVTAFPVAAPVVHSRYVSVYSRRTHRRRWVLAAAPAPSGMLAAAERPAHDLTAAPPIDPNMRVVPQPVALAAQPLSPGAQAELAASRRAEQAEQAPARGVPDNAAPESGAQPQAAPAAVAQALGMRARVAAARPRQQLALHRPLLPLSARMVQRPTAPGAHATQAHVAAGLPGVGGAAPGPARNGVSMYHAAAAPATLGEPVYDAASRTLRLPLAGRLPEGPLHVYRLDNGRAYVDVAGAQASSVRPTLVHTPDGTFQRGAIASHPDTGVTRMSFDLGNNGDMSAAVEGGQIVIRAKKR